MWSSNEEWEIAARSLARKFLSNFCRFTYNPETSKLVSAGPVYDIQVKP
jgi:ATP-dependent phosphoenolpyruvate carboxykinase